MDINKFMSIYRESLEQLSEGEKLGVDKEHIEWLVWRVGQLEKVVNAWLSIERDGTEEDAVNFYELFREKLEER